MKFIFFFLAMMIATFYVNAQSAILTQVIQYPDTTFRFGEYHVYESDTVLNHVFPPNKLTISQFLDYTYKLARDEEAKQLEYKQKRIESEAKNAYLIGIIDQVLGSGTYAGVRANEVQNFIQGQWRLTATTNGNTDKKVIVIAGLAVTSAIPGDKNDGQHTGTIAVIDGETITLTGKNIVTGTVTLKLNINGNFEGIGGTTKYILKRI